MSNRPSSSLTRFIARLAGPRTRAARGRCKGTSSPVVPMARVHFVRKFLIGGSATLLAITACSGPAGPSRDGQPTDSVSTSASGAWSIEHQRHEISVNGTTRSYELYLPVAGGCPAWPVCEGSDSRPPDRLLPVVVALHGKGSSALEMASATNLTAAAARRGMAVAYPSGLHDAWGDNPRPTKLRPDPDADIAFLNALARDLVAHRGADPDRLYLAGFSNGANMTLRMAATSFQSFRAFAAVAGQLPVGIAVSGAGPLLMIYGSEDPLRPYDGLPTVPSAAPKIGAEPPVTTIGTESTAQKFADIAGATEVRQEQLPDPIPDATTITRYRWIDSKGRSPIVLLKVHGGGHTWPGGTMGVPELNGPTSHDIDAADTIVEFFQASEPVR